MRSPASNHCEANLLLNKFRAQHLLKSCIIKNLKFFSDYLYILYRFIRFSRWFSNCFSGSIQLPKRLSFPFEMYSIWEYWRPCVQIFSVFWYVFRWFEAIQTTKFWNKLCQWRSREPFHTTRSNWCYCGSVCGSAYQANNLRFTCHLASMLGMLKPRESHQIRLCQLKNSLIQTIFVKVFGPGGLKKSGERGDTPLSKPPFYHPVIAVLGSHIHIHQVGSVHIASVASTRAPKTYFWLFWEFGVIRSLIRGDILASDLKHVCYSCDMCVL